MGWVGSVQSEANYTVLSPAPPWIPRPGLGSETGLGGDWGHALDTLVHIIQGGGHLFASTGKIMGLRSASSRAPGGLTIPFFHISSCLAESTLPPELGTMLQRWETCFRNIGIRPQCKGCLSSFPCGWHCPGWALPLAECVTGELPPFWLSRLLSRQTQRTDVHPSCTSHLSET